MTQQFIKMKNQDEKLIFKPKNPKQWKSHTRTIGVPQLKKKR